MTDKKQYTPEELNEIIKWFQSRINRLPKSQVIDQATMVPDVRVFFETMQYIISVNGEKPAYKGQIEILFKLRKVLVEEHEDLKDL